MTEMNLGALGTSFVHYRPGLKIEPKYAAYNALKEAFYEETDKETADQMPAFRKMHARLRKIGAMRKKDIGSAADIGDVQSLLQNYTVMYGQEPFIGLELLPVLPTEQEGGIYMEYIRGAEFDVAARPGGNGNALTSSEVSDYNRKKVTFSVVSDSAFDYVGKDQVMLVNTPINAMFDLRERVDMQIAFRREVAIRDVVTNTSNYNTTNKLTLTPGIRWDENGGDPGGDILAAVAKMWRGSGTTRLVGWTSLEVWNVLRQSSNLLKLLPLTHQGYVTPQQFIEIFGLDGLLVSEARYNTANVAKAFSPARLWGKNFGLMRVTSNPQQRNACFGWTYRWRVPQMPSGMEANLWFDPRRGDFGSFGYKLALKEQPVVVAKDTGYLFSSVIS